MSPSILSQTEATETGRRSIDAENGSREGFRPVALPALAAACRITGPAARVEDRPAAGRRGILEMVHEDAPIL